MVRTSFRYILALALSLMVCSAKAEETKHYNFGTRPAPSTGFMTEEPPQPSEDSKPADEAPKPDAEAPAVTPEVALEKPASKLVNGVYSPGNSGTITPSSPATSTKLSKAKQAEKAEQLVRFFIGSCFKFYGRNDDMIKYMDDNFPRLDSDRKADFAPTINGTATTQYWDIVRGDNFYMLAKDTSSGKCDVIAKDGASTAIHKELKAVMDGLTITKIVDTKTEYEKIPHLNKEVSIVNILGHPLEKELGIVATTQIKETGDNMAAILTLFTVPQESVEIKETP